MATVACTLLELLVSLGALLWPTSPTEFLEQHNNKTKQDMNTQFSLVRDTNT